MNREEQIRKANPHHGNGAVSLCKSIGFIEGANWADKNPVSPWISVEERLPEEYEEVLARYSSYGENKYDVLFIYGSSEWCFADQEEYIDENMIVTHWMPIPSFDEILKSNKDVLKRIKEKGD